MAQYRRCSRPGCGKPAVATLTYAYAESTAVVGPLAAVKEPHAWDLCERHAGRITAPLGWDLVRVEDIEIDDDEDLIALAEAVRVAGRVTSGLVDADYPAGADPIDRPNPHTLADPADPLTSEHPVLRTKRVAADNRRRRSHLHVVREDEPKGSS
ncbi:DUF3499 domain-containing protein [Corynebacterium uterequi]|uniref:DUF3499 domain-containing protein n=1 Tax=Corynebacterium uterequi TaxID=1072256 RepID=UPI000640CA57|nr:DUF3499 domain-containing protein [Corynebacterium uterequi]